MPFIKSIYMGGSGVLVAFLDGVDIVQIKIHYRPGAVLKPVIPALWEAEAGGS